MTKNVSLTLLKNLYKEYGVELQYIAKQGQHHPEKLFKKEYLNFSQKLNAQYNEKFFSEWRGEMIIECSIDMNSQPRRGDTIIEINI